MVFDALTSSFNNDQQGQQKQMQNKVELELVKERQEQFLELEKGLYYHYFYVIILSSFYKTIMIVRRKCDWIYNLDLKIFFIQKRYCRSQFNV